MNSHLSLLSRIKSQPVTLISAFLFSAAILALGYWSFGFVTMLIFTSGFIGGFLLWILAHSDVSFEHIRIPFYVSFVFFIFHRVEEKYFGFFDFLSEYTGEPKPEVQSFKVVALVLLSVGAWILIPYLVKRKIEFGYYLAWTFFASLGITELAHWCVFPLFDDFLFDYVPGMFSVLFLAPVAWWGIFRLLDSNLVVVNTKR